MCDPTQEHVVGSLSSVHRDDLSSKYSQWGYVVYGTGLCYVLGHIVALYIYWHCLFLFKFLFS
jgi:hypothetical protein